MANTRYAYVKQFELVDTLLPGCWIVVRLDGRGFTKFATEHSFEKPTDNRALDLMDHCATELMRMLGDIKLAYGESDEYSLVLHKRTQLYGRRNAKILSTVVSAFTGHYIAAWPRFFPNTTLKTLPVFDGRCVCYPTDETLRDYLAWRQADTHINNQYNTCFWLLVQKEGKTPTEAQHALKGTQTGDKNELLWKHGINYSELPARSRKGTVVVRQKSQRVIKVSAGGQLVHREVSEPVTLHVDIIGPAFWCRPDIVEAVGMPSKPP